MSAATLTVRSVGESIADRVTAATWWVLAAWLALLATLHAMIWAGQGWVWFPQGARLLFSSSWTHLYALHSDLQIGPLTFVLVSPVVFAVPAGLGKIAAMILMSGAGLVVLAQIRALLPGHDTALDRRFLVSGLCFLVLWAELAVTFAHADDVLAILFSVLALRALRSDRPYLAAVLLALAADCKPWAVMFVPLLLLCDRRHRARGLALWAAVVAAAWLPFYLADPRTLSVTTFGIPNNLASSLRVLGQHSATTPAWVRPTQIVVAVLLGLILVHRRRWSAVIVVAVAVRLLFDPAVWSYYDAGLLTGAVICDLLLLAGPVPLLSLGAVLVFYLPMFPLGADPRLYGLIRTAFLISVIVGLTLLPDSTLRPRRTPSTTSLA